MQSEAISAVIDNPEANIIVEAFTGTGKTEVMLALAAMTLNPEHGEPRKVAYVGPLKALVEEKYDECQEAFPDASTEMMTGDFTMSERKKKDLDRANIILMTPEMMDSRVRNRDAEGNSWLYQIGAWVIDETHLMDDKERGDKLESAIMRFGRNVQHCRILGLSATMSNADTICEWWTHLTGRPTIPIHSDYQATERRFSYHRLNFAGGFGSQAWHAEEGARMGESIRLLRMYPDSQFIFFSGNKGFCYKFVQEAERMGIDGVATHNADLDRMERRKVERAFKAGDLRAIVATTTLAIGCNLPAERVVIVHEKLGTDPMNAMIRQQMAGRSGRPQFYPVGYVHLLCKPNTEANIKADMTRKCVVNSNIANDLAFHILASICAEEVTGTESLQAWYEDTFARYQNPVGEDELLSAVAELAKLGMIEKEAPWQATHLGKASAKFYLPVKDCADWYRNFRALDGDSDDRKVAFAFADVDSFRDPNKGNWIAKNEVPLLKFKQGVGSVAKWATAYFDALTEENPRNWTFKQFVGILRSDIERIGTFLELIRRPYKLKVDPRRLAMRIKYGVRDQLVDLCMVPGVGAARAKVLWNAGIQSAEAILKMKKSKLADVFGAKVAEQIVSGAKELLGEAEEWKERKKKQELSKSIAKDDDAFDDDEAEESREAASDEDDGESWDDDYDVNAVPKSKDDEG